MALHTAGRELLDARNGLHTPMMQLHAAQTQIRRLTLNHDQPTIWPDHI